MEGRAVRPAHRWNSLCVAITAVRFSLSLSLSSIFHPSNSFFSPRTATRRENPTFSSVLLSMEILRIFPIRYPPLRYVKAYSRGEGEGVFLPPFVVFFSACTPTGRQFLRSNDHHRRPRYREIIRKICPLSADPRQPPQLPSLFLPNGQEIDRIFSFRSRCSTTVYCNACYLRL